MNAEEIARAQREHTYQALSATIADLERLADELVAMQLAPVAASVRAAVHALEMGYADARELFGAIPPAAAIVPQSRRAALVAAAYDAPADVDDELEL